MACGVGMRRFLRIRLRVCASLVEYEGQRSGIMTLRYAGSVPKPHGGVGRWSNERTEGSEVLKTLFNIVEDRFEL